MEHGFKKWLPLCSAFFLFLNASAEPKIVAATVSYSFNGKETQRFRSQSWCEKYLGFGKRDPYEAEEWKEKSIEAKNFGILFYKEGFVPIYKATVRGEGRFLVPSDMQCLPIKPDFTVEGDLPSKRVSSVPQPHRFNFKRTSLGHGHFISLRVTDGFYGQQLKRSYQVVAVVKDSSGEDRLLSLHVDGSRQGVRVSSEVERGLHRFIVVSNGYIPQVVAFDAARSAYEVQLCREKLVVNVQVVDGESLRPIRRADIRLQRFSSGDQSIRKCGFTDVDGRKLFNVKAPRKDDRLTVYKDGYASGGSWELRQLRKNYRLSLKRDSRPVTIRFLKSDGLPLVGVNVRSVSTVDWLRKDFGATEYTSELQGDIPVAETTFAFDLEDYSFKSVEVQGADWAGALSGCQVRPGKDPVQLTVMMSPVTKSRQLIGTVIGSDKKPLAGVSVSIVCPNSVTEEKTTGSNGLFSARIRHQEGEAISITVNHPAYQSASQEIFRVDENSLVIPLKLAQRSLLVLLNRSERMSRLDFRRLKLAVVEGIDGALRHEGWSSVGLGVFSDGTIDWLLPLGGKQGVGPGLDSAKQELMATGNYGSTDMAATIKAAQGHILENALDGTPAKKSRVVLISEVDPVIDLMPSDLPAIQDMRTATEQMNTEFFVFEISASGDEYSETLQEFCSLSGGRSVSFSDRADTDLYSVMNQTGCFRPDQTLPAEKPEVFEAKPVEGGQGSEENEEKSVPGGQE